MGVRRSWRGRGEGVGVIVLIEWETGSIRNRRSESWPPFWSYFARTGFKQLPNSFVSERQKKNFWVNLNISDTVANFTETVLYTVETYKSTCITVYHIE